MEAKNLHEQGSKIAMSEQAVSKFDIAKSMFDNIEFLHDSLFKKARIALIAIGVVLAGVYAYIPSNADVIAETLSFGKESTNIKSGIVWILTVFFSYNTVAGLWRTIDSLAENLPPTVKIDVKENDGEVWERTLWSPNTMREVPPEQFIERFINISKEEKYAERFVIYIRYMGVIIDRRVGMADAALKNIRWAAVSLVLWVFVLEVFNKIG